MLYPGNFRKRPTKYGVFSRLPSFCLILAAGLWHGHLRAHDIISTNLTYSRDVSRILARRCAGCHSAVDPIPLTSYGEVRPWAVGIKEQVLTRAMPPWGAVKGFGNLSPDEALSQEEVMTIAEWVIGGAPEGNKLLLPAPAVQTQARRLRIGGAGIPVDGRIELQHDFLLSGLSPKPLGKRVDSSRIIAKLPDGEVVPLLWLFQYESKWSRTFTFRSPISLPAGTVVESSNALPFRLESSR